MAAWFLGDVTGMVVSILILMQNSEGCVAGAPGPVPDRVIGAPSSWAIVGRLMPRLRPLVAPRHWLGFGWRAKYQPFGSAISGLFPVPHGAASGGLPIAPPFPTSKTLISVNAHASQWR